jgi:N-acetylneuraminic acid mutarotase
LFFSDEDAWKKMECKGETPTPRVSATMAAVGNKLYLFGGLNQDSGWQEGIHVLDIGL